MTRRRIVAVDLGTTKACCVVAAIEPQGLRLLGVGEAAAKDVYQRLIVGPEVVAEAVEQAEQMAGLPIDTAVVCIAGGHITSQNSRGIVAVAAGHREVKSQDVSRVLEAAGAVSVPSDQRVVHVLPQEFKVDGQEGVRDAIGLSGNRLEVETHVVIGTNTAIQSVTKVMHQAGLGVDDMVLQALASAESVVDEDELEQGVVVVDVGGGTTDIAVFKRGGVVHTAVIPVGGTHVTSDLAVGLRCDLDTAEAVKRRYGHCLQLSVPSEASIELTPMDYDEPQVVPRRYLAEVIGPRAREMAQLIAAEIAKTGTPIMYPAGVVLTGGGSLLRGFAEVVQQVTNLPVRLAIPSGVHGMEEEIDAPSYATVVGLLRWTARSRVRSRRSAQGYARRRSNEHAGNGSNINVRLKRWIRVKRWIREFF